MIHHTVYTYLRFQSRPIYVQFIWHLSLTCSYLYVHSVRRHCFCKATDYEYSNILFDRCYNHVWPCTKSAMQCSYKICFVCNDKMNMSIHCSSDYICEAVVKIHEIHNALTLPVTSFNVITHYVWLGRLIGSSGNLIRYRHAVSVRF